MTRPLWFDAPKEVMEIRMALATHFRGISLRVPAPIISEYNDWRQALLRAHRGIIPSDMDAREKETEFLRRMVNSVLERGDEASALLEHYLDRLPGAVACVPPACPQKCAGPTGRPTERCAPGPCPD